MGNKFYLVRHAQSAPDKSLPEPEWPLSELGKTQAHELVSSLEPLGITRIVSSPYPRAVYTVSPYAQQAGIEIETHPDLRERKLSGVMIDNWLEKLEHTWSDFDFHLDGGESSRVCQVRVKACIQSYLDTFPEDTFAFSSHGNALALYLNSLNPGFGFAQWRQLGNPELIEVNFENGHYTFL